MFHGVLALLTRSLRQDARQLRNHVFRLTFVTFIYLALLVATLTAGMFGAPGLHFFKSITLLNQFFITCAGIGFFASAITEEKEEETIGLLMMAGLNPLGILLGKSTSRLIQASMLLVVQFPFMLLSVTLGGVTPHQIIAAYVALLAFMTLLANVALVWSTVCERGGSAAGLTTILLIVYAVAPYLLPSLATEFARLGLTTGSWYGRMVFSSLEWLAESSVYTRLQTIMATGFNEAVISRQVITNLIGGLICFLFAWLVFVPATNRSTAGSGSRGLVLRSSHRLRIFSPGRPWAMPLAWKDFQFIAGGFSFAVVKLFLYVLLLAGIVYTSILSGGTFYWDGIAGLYTTCLMWAVGIEACILAARIFHDEVRLQTWSTLLMLPRSVPYLAYTKALGCLLGLCPSIACLCLSTLLIPGIEPATALQVLIDPFTWGIVLMIAIFLHLVALLSLFARWGALPLAIVMMAPISICCPIWQLLFLVIGRGNLQDSMGTLAATATVWILMGLVCFVFQMMIGARLQEIGSK